MATIITKIEIKEANGLHARPAAELSTLAKKFNSNITLCFASKEASAASIISVLALGLKKGSIIDLKIDGEDSEKATQEIITFFENLR